MIINFLSLRRNIWVDFHTEVLEYINKIKTKIIKN